MVGNKVCTNSFWKAKFTLLLSLFVFVSYNNNVSAIAPEAIKTELLIVKNDLPADILFSVEVSAIQNLSRLSNLYFYGLDNLQFNLDCSCSTLLVKSRLALFLAFGDRINMFWRIISHSTYSDEADSVMV